MSECCHALLMQQFTDEALDLPQHRHLCCDVCASVCLCEDCNFSVNSPADDSSACTCTSSILSVNQDSNARDAPEAIQATLKEQLLSYRKQLSKKFAHTTALVGIKLCTGLTDQTISSIAVNCLNIRCADDILEYGVTSRVYCSTIFDIVNNVITKN